MDEIKFKILHFTKLVISEDISRVEIDAEVLCSNPRTIVTVGYDIPFDKRKTKEQIKTELLDEFKANHPDVQIFRELVHGDIL